jgi:hypothetical protein
MNLTPLEIRLTLRAISNAVDKYDAAIDRTPRNFDIKLDKLETERESLISAYKKIKNHEPASHTPTT